MARPLAPISVVIPCYRCASTIARAVASVFAQSLMPAELVLVEDCSGDETLAVLQELQRDSGGRIRIVPLQANGGPASARNAGWAIATQPYVAFLDADDSWHPEKLRIQYDFMRTNPDVAVCGHGRMQLRGGESPSVLPNHPEVTRMSARGLLFKSAFSMPTVMLKRDIPFRFTAGQRYVEDAFLWQQIALAQLAVMRIECDLAYIHKAPYGSSGLSAQLWNMERAELENFFAHYRSGKIGLGMLAAAALFSLAKYLRRLVFRLTGQTC